MISFPPSPALSDCDSLASEELDALLEAQGELSHWPTPPLSDGGGIETSGSCSSADVELDYYQTASIFSNEASTEEERRIDIALIEKILLRAQLPPEVLALAFNILSGLNRQSLSDDFIHSTPSDLLVASALSLAVLYTVDHPPSFAYWARSVCDLKWTALHIDKVVLRVLVALDWRLHPFSSPTAIQEAIATLFAPAMNDSRRDMPPIEEDWNFLSQPEQRHSGKPMKLKVMVEDRSACWVNGQITPEGTPTESGFDCAWNSNHAL